MIPDYIAARALDVVQCCESIVLLSRSLSLSLFVLLILTLAYDQGKSPWSQNCLALCIGRSAQKVGGRVRVPKAENRYDLLKYCTTVDACD